MATGTPPTDQQASTRPIAFVLDNAGSISAPVTLTIRPEDLTRTEPARISVHQSLGRGISGWVDDFGPGLPSITISGHTGWRQPQFGGEDGADAFHTLNNLIVRDFPNAKTGAIASGIDPAMVKLLFIDLLDDFTWNVVAPQFVLRRSKSRPLLFQYNISLQAISTDIDSSGITIPYYGSIAAGINSLEIATDEIAGFEDSIEGIASGALGAGMSLAATLKSFVGLAAGIFSAVSGLISQTLSIVSSVVNSAIQMARDIAQIGANVMRTISAIKNIGVSIKAALNQIASAFNEVLCILSNSLRPKNVYSNYGDVYGASNCSSTTGGNAPSIFGGQNVFGLITGNAPANIIGGAAIKSIGALKGFDPVLAPMSMSEMNGNLVNVLGVRI